MISGERTGGQDQPALIAAELGVSHYFHPALKSEAEHYGDAVLSRLPMELKRAGSLPRAKAKPGHERRGALWVQVRCDNWNVQFLTTHLGLTGHERLMQTQTLLGSEWLAHPDCRPPVILAGDLNAWPGSTPYRIVRAALNDAQTRNGVKRPSNTFPSRLPLLRIDHVFVSPSLQVRSVNVPRTTLTRVASDHLPVIVEVTLS